MLTERQLQLLSAIIKEYTKSAEPVGSTLIVEKYDIKCSPATVRNEMSNLLDGGYLQMLHTSSGRIPTTAAYKLFLREMMQEDDLDVLQEVALKQRLWAKRYEFEKMLKQAVDALSELTQELSFATTEDKGVLNSGIVNLLDYKEFIDRDVAKAAVLFVERYELVEKVLESANLDDRIGYLIGNDLDNELLRECGLVFARYKIGKRSGYVGVFGPARMNYQRIVPSVRYTRSLIEELGGSW